MATKVILDTDPGHDDAVALLLALASPELELLGVTTVAGNQTIEKTTRNALITRSETNSAWRRCGHTLTLSPGSALTCWIDPDLTTVRRRCVWPSGPVIVGAGAVATEDVPARAVVVGIPARKIREVEDEDLLERWR
jgi:hypothetical protein